jgi:arylsulfatase
MGDRTSLTLYEGMELIMENVFINVKNRSHVIEAKVEIPANANGVILCQGGRFAGWTLYMKDGKVAYEYNFFGRERYSIDSPEALPAGKATIRYEFAYEGGEEAGKGGTGTIFINDKKVAEGKIDQTVPFIFSADETADVGSDHHTPVSDQYPQFGNEFTGKIAKVTIDLK